MPRRRRRNPMWPPLRFGSGMCQSGTACVMCGTAWRRRPPAPPQRRRRRAGNRRSRGL